jgi:glycosyltransferase involved in cell wall biosynthesis
MKSLTVLVPIYNESRTLAELVNQIDSMLSNIIAECIFINDGSTDTSGEVLTDALTKVSFKHQVLTQPNRGKSSAIKAGAKLVRSSHAIILDADLELETYDVIKLWKVVQEEKADVVFGYRHFLAQSAFTYRYAKGNLVISNLYGLLYNEVVTDIMCGYKLVPTKVLQDLPYKFKKFAIEIEIPIYLWKQRIRPYEIKVGYSPRSRLDGKMISAMDAVMIIYTLVVHRILKARR